MTGCHTWLDPTVVDGEFATTPPAIHVTEAFLRDDYGRAVLTERYHVGERCPDRRGVRHAELRSDDPPRWVDLFGIDPNFSEATP